MGTWTESPQERLALLQEEFMQCAEAATAARAPTRDDQILWAVGLLRELPDDYRSAAELLLGGDPWRARNSLINDSRGPTREALRIMQLPAAWEPSHWHTVARFMRVCCDALRVNGYLPEEDPYPEWMRRLTGVSPGTQRWSRFGQSA